MKRLLLLAIPGAFLLASCTAFEETYYLDREFGEASQAAWDQQIAYPGRQIEKVPTGLEGMTAEEIIDVHTRTFGEKPTEMEVFTFDLMGD